MERPDGLVSEATIISRAHGIIAGLQLVDLVMHHIDPSVSARPYLADGDTSKPETYWFSCTVRHLRTVRIAQRTSGGTWRNLTGLTEDLPVRVGISSTREKLVRSRVRPMVAASDGAGLR